MTQLLQTAPFIIYLYVSFQIPIPHPDTLQAGVPKTGTASITFPLSVARSRRFGFIVLMRASGEARVFLLRSSARVYIYTHTRVYLERVILRVTLT